MDKKSRKPRLNLSTVVLNNLQEISEVLKDRGAKKVDLGELIERLFFQDSATNVINEFVTDKTPTEYKLNALMNDPAAKEKLLGVIADRDFGVKYRGTSEPSQPQT